MIKAVIEISKGSHCKYEINKETNILELDRIIYPAYPFSYGFIPNTLQLDGDALDVFVLFDEPLQPLSQVTIDIIGVLKCIDNGVQDDKVIAVIKNTNMAEITQEKSVERIKSFLRAYKPGFKVEAYLSKKVAELIIEHAQDEFLLDQSRPR